MAAISDFPTRPGFSLAAARSAIGFGQGFVLWLLYSATQAHAWPATAPLLFAPLLFVALFIPVIALIGLGNLRPGTFAAWLAAALLAVVVIALHEAARNPGPVFEPRAAVFAGLTLALFIAQALVAAGDADRQLVAAYPTYFDIAWKQQVQLQLALLFVGAFWLVVWLGSGLFWLIGIQALQRLIAHPAFAMPASALAFACALHVCDVRLGLVQGMRNLLHVLLAWLLPVAAGLIVAFLASLPFTGLQPLWQTSHGAGIVLIAAAVLVVLINTVYRDGEDGARPAILRWAGTAAALCLPVLVAISAYGLGLRVGQRGWTEPRVVGAACEVIAGCYAVGYALAATRRGPWFKWLEATNVDTAWVVLAAIVVLASPIADPARLSVDDQVARLESGRIAPEKFDFKYLRFDGAGYGREALARLKNAQGPNAAAIRKYAEAALAMKSAYEASPAHRADLSAIPVFPAGQSLPQSFLQQDWQADKRRYLLPQCMVFLATKCEAYLTAGPAGKIIVFADLDKYATGAVAMRQDARGVWRPIGSFANLFICEALRQAMRAGQYRWVPPSQPDLEIAGQLLPMTPTPPPPRACP